MGTENLRCGVTRFSSTLCKDLDSNPQDGEVSVEEYLSQKALLPEVADSQLAGLLAENDPDRSLQFLKKVESKAPHRKGSLYQHVLLYESSPLYHAARQRLLESPAPPGLRIMSDIDGKIEHLLVTLDSNLRAPNSMLSPFLHLAKSRPEIRFTVVIEPSTIPEFRKILREEKIENPSRIKIVPYEPSNRPMRPYVWPQDPIQVVFQADGKPAILVGSNVSPSISHRRELDPLSFFHFGQVVAKSLNWPLLISPLEIDGGGFDFHERFPLCGRERSEKSSFKQGRL